LGVEDIGFFKEFLSDFSLADFNEQLTKDLIFFKLIQIDGIQLTLTNFEKGVKTERLEKVRLII
jgi:hypothetical protein